LYLFSSYLNISYLKKEYFIYGLRPVIEAITSGKEVEKILVQQGLKGEVYGELRKLVAECEIPMQFVPVERLNRFQVGNHQGVVAFISPITYQPLEQIVQMVFEQGKVPLFLILDGITDVRNFGAIARTAECAGVDALIIPDRGSAQINADAVKTSAGALNKIPVCRIQHLRKTCQYLMDSGVELIACTEKGSRLYHDISYKEPLAIIIGGEETGISSDVLRMAGHLVRIPLQGDIASLNVSVAAGVILYEAVRQRQSE
jgi:23S rRNA (guanosine2251-2'-O)-methyltransferase